MIDTTLQGPGFFVFFQRNIIESGGFPEAWKYRPVIKFKREEEKQAAKVVEEIFEHAEPDATLDDLELILRLQLRNQEIALKVLYINWLEQEYALYVKWRNEQNAVFLLLLQ